MFRNGSGHRTRSRGNRPRADYWKSQARKYCNFCKCWIADNKPSIQYHENGKRHKENVAKKISTLVKQSAKQYKENTKLDAEMKKMEEEALKAYRNDMESNPDITSREIMLRLEGKGQNQLQEEITNEHLNNAGESEDFSPVETSDKKDSNKNVEPSEIPSDQKATIWYKSQSEQGYTYYWNPQTKESKWEIPSGNCKILEEGSEVIESKKAIKMKQVEVENDKKLIEEEIKAYTNREKMRIKYNKINEKKSNKQSKSDENVTTQPKKVAANPYGHWTSVVNSEEKPIDLQLPSKGEAEIKVATATARASTLLAEAEQQEEEEVWNLEIGEKTVGNYCMGGSIGTVSDTTPSVFKKRKLNNRANLRQRFNCTEEDYN